MAVERGRAMRAPTVGRPGDAQHGPRALFRRFMRQRQPLIALELAIVVGLLALLYLNQIATVTSAHDTLLQEQTQQTELRRQDAELHAQLGQAQNPAYVERRARALGMVPANPASVVWITIHDTGK